MTIPHTTWPLLNIEHTINRFVFQTIRRQWYRGIFCWRHHQEIVVFQFRDFVNLFISDHGPIMFDLWDNDGQYCLRCKNSVLIRLNYYETTFRDETIEAIDFDLNDPNCFDKIEKFVLRRL